MHRGPGRFWVILPGVGLLALAALALLIDVEILPIAVVDVVLAAVSLGTTRRARGPLSRAMYWAALVGGVISCGYLTQVDKGGLNLGVGIWLSAIAAVAAFIVITVLGWAILRVLQPDVRTIEVMSAGAGAGDPVGVSSRQPRVRGRTGRHIAGAVLVVSVLTGLAWWEVDAWQSLAYSRETSTMHLRLIWTLGDRGEQAGVLGNPRAPGDVVREMAWRGDDDFYVSCACRNPQLTDAELRALLAARPDSACREGVAGNPSATPGLLEELFATQVPGQMNRAVVTGLALNPSTPRDVLTELAKEPLVRNGHLRDALRSRGVDVPRPTR